MTDLAFALRDYRISHTAMIIYGMLNSLSNAAVSKQKGYVFISRKSIAAKVNKCERTARKCVKELESVGLIHIKRMGRGLNDRIWILPPHCPQEEAEQKIANSNMAIYRTETVKVAALNINTKKINNNQVDISINPENQRLNVAQRPEDKGFTAKKGRPTNKRPRRNIEKETALRKYYTDLLKKQLKYEEYRHDYFTMREDVEALEKVISLIANYMSGNTKIMVNGALLTKSQWWDMVKNIEQWQILDLIAKIPHFQNVRKPQAYLLACMYNSALHETLMKPWYIPDSVLDNLY